MSPADRQRRGGAVFLDVGGTLVEVSPSVGHVYAEACARRGAMVDAIDLQRAFDAAWAALSSVVPRGADRYRLFPGGEREWWERVSSHAFGLCGVDPDRRPDVEDLRAVFARAGAWRVYPEAHEALRALRVAGFRLGIISNWDSRLPALLAALGLDVHFETITYSAAAGCEKPSRGIFAAALDAMEVEAADAVHIGDRFEEDYAGARSAGLRALLLDRGPAGPGREDSDGEVGRWVDRNDRVADLRQAAARIAG